MTEKVPDWDKRALGARRRVKRSEWANAVVAGEQRRGASKGWLIGDEGEDQPCIVFLTDAAIYVRTYVRLPGDEASMTRAPLEQVRRAGFRSTGGPSDPGGKKQFGWCIVFVASNEDESDFQSFGIYLPGGFRSLKLAKRIAALDQATYSPPPD
jgi:hypothetical protein